jgi:hypothetical protein
MSDLAHEDAPAVSYVFSGCGCDSAARLSRKGLPAGLPAARDKFEVWAFGPRPRILCGYFLSTGRILADSICQTTEVSRTAGPIRQEKMAARVAEMVTKPFAVDALAAPFAR